LLIKMALRNIFAWVGIMIFPISTTLLTDYKQEPPHSASFCFLILGGTPSLHLFFCTPISLFVWKNNSWELFKYLHLFVM
jgi:hypothetical protein